MYTDHRPGPPAPPSSPTRYRFASRVLPGAALVRATFVRHSALIRVDFPTFDRPASATCARPSWGMPWPRPPAAALVTKSAERSFNLYRDGIRDRGSGIRGARIPEAGVHAGDEPIPDP